MKTSKELYGKIKTEYGGKAQFMINLYVTYSDDAYGIQIDKLSLDEMIELKSESANNIAATKAEAENIIKNWIEELF